ncbi:MAG TPA: rhodanese-like domain-containing protein, partial [Thermoanaerobaculia bacterium]
ISFLAFLFAATTVAATDDVPRMTIHELRDALARGEAVALDVRGSVPFAMGHIEGAIWTPLGAIATKVGELPRDKMLVAYCTCQAEELSTRAVAELRKHGFTKLAALRGGYQAWSEAGFPLIRTAPEEVPPPPPIPSEQLTQPLRGGRLMPPAEIRCKADDVTVYNGRVISYSRTASRTTLKIRTDYDTTEVATIKSSDPSRFFLMMRKPFTAADWKRIEVRKGVLRPGMRAHAWVCTDGRTLIDWRPDEVDAVE